MQNMRRKPRYLLGGTLILLALFAVTTAAGAAVCQIKAHQNGHSPLPFPCCHVAGAISAGPMITHVEPLTAYFPGVATMVPALLIFTIFHPPHA
jgi:hypothetical protein